MRTIGCFLPAVMLMSLVPAFVAAAAPQWRCWGPGLPDPCRNELLALSVVPGSGGTEAWAVGRAGTLVHGNGATWEKAPVDTDITFFDIAMIRSDLGWAVGDMGKIYMWSGSTWRPYQQVVNENQLIRAIEPVPGTDPVELWAPFDFGGIGSFLRFDGSRWKTETGLFSGSIYALDMLSSNLGWAVGGHIGDGTIHRYDGSVWDQIETVDQQLRDLDFATPNDGWAVGDDGAIYHWNGSSWTGMDPVTEEDLHAVLVVAADDVWAVGIWGAVVHWDGSSWTDLSSYSLTLNLRDIALTDAGRALVVGEAGFIAAWDGATWSPVFESPIEDLRVISATPESEDLWAAGSQSSLFRWGGEEWKEIEGSAYYYHSMAMVSATDGWANGFQRFHHWDGLRWQETQEAESASDMVMVGPDDGWAVGWGTIRRFNGATWEEVTPPTTRTLRGVSAVAPDDVWAAGYNGTILHFDGTEWTTVHSPVDRSLDGISMAGPNEGYIVGLKNGQGVALKWNGFNWQTIFLPSDAHDLFGVDVIDSDNGTVGWMVGASGYTARLSEGFWTSVPTDTSNRLVDVITVSADEAWAVGDGGVILHWSENETAPGTSGSLITAAAKLSGQAGTDWKTDLIVANAGEDATTVSVEAWLRDQANPNPQRRSVSLQVGAAETMEDVLGDLFGLPNGSAASLFLDADQPLAVSSRTYNSTPSGTFGQSIPEAPMGEVFSAGQVAHLTGLVEGPSFRSNLGIVNTSEVSIQVHADFFDDQSQSLGSMIYNVPARGSIQKTRVLRDVASGPVDQARVELRCPDGAFTAYVSVVDAATGDPVYRPASLAGSGHAESVLQGIARVAGSVGTNWRSTMVLANMAEYHRPMTFHRLVRGQANPDPQQASVTLDPGEIRVIDDVLRDLYGMDSGAISLRVDGWADVLVTARTFNETPAGTFGQLIPSQRQSEAVATGFEGVLVGVVQNNSFRSNLGLTNASGSPVEVSLKLVGPGGNQIGDVQSVVLGGGEVAQFDRVAEIFGATTVSGATLTVATPTGGSVHAFLSVIDNRTGDPVFRTPTIAGGTAR